MRHTGQTGVVLRLGSTQTLAWASSYYLPALLAAPLAAELGIAVTQVFGAFTLALVISALVGPAAGRAIDRHGGRAVLLVTNLLFATGLAALGLAQAGWQVWAAWCLIGVAMGSGLYDAAFATLVRLYPVSARNAITGITLIAGFASTVGWPLTQWGLDTLGWRGTCLGWAALHLVLGLPLHSALPRGRVEATPAVQSVAVPGTAPAAPAPSHATAGRGVAMVLAAVFAIAWFTSTAMAAHLPLLLQAQGLSTSAALGVAMLVGPAQVAGRLLEFGLLRRAHPLLSSRFATAGHPIGVLLLALGGPVGAWLFAVMHGMGNGILTIAKGTLPLVVFGAAGYGERQGWLMAPARVSQAFAPVLFGLAMAHWGGHALWLTAGLGLLALALLQGLALHMARRAVAPPATTPRPGAPA
ncbi:MFS transporter [Hydrogenophaga pseudoflava]|uniref:MFS transporter n=1 Tax=Hydrogenophaga pseudoflava TaxID=47421 RepID=UPI0027E456D6|nr:MFS transporter [Hydrogenophaga pseudoflava]MDQ7746281.1 MFS transporter [Hydrogenophaga pseudoflava]